MDVCWVSAGVLVHFILSVRMELFQVRGCQCVGMWTLWVWHIFSWFQHPYCPPYVLKPSFGLLKVTPTPRPITISYQRCVDKSKLPDTVPKPHTIIEPNVTNCKSALMSHGLVNIGGFITIIRLIPIISNSPRSPSATSIKPPDSKTLAFSKFYLLTFTFPFNSLRCFLFSFRHA